MKKVLFLPLFTMNSGHHQTAEALMDSFSKNNPEIICEKVDFLSYFSKPFEQFISKYYMKGITRFPSFYSSFYQKFFNKSSALLHYTYEVLFLEKMETLLSQKQPDLIVCTHSFTSLLVSKLKEYGVCHAPVINCYTDFFINGLWGSKGTDWHFVPNKDVKERLIAEGVPSGQVIVTGILTHDAIKSKKRIKKKSDKLHILVAGGSQGLGENFSLLEQVEESHSALYRVLCGSNHRLFQQLSELNSEAIIPLSYISSPQSMNELYEWADAIITKPGGVTTSEALKKNLPIFIHSVLPGQEEMNLAYLELKGVIHRLESTEPLEEQLFARLNNEAMEFRMRKNRFDYLNEIEVESNEELFHFIHENIMNPPSQHDEMIDSILSKIYASLDANV
ncbi:MGDG synthase family glycosyltransferase [Metabacillus arenae]|uniref:Galactosyldiacylglycerol synthase n=1 Tax=Metabacillus arenae TaxID=2771434 RepID=A0A926NDV3_9BACI|nr:glycosyltransferase [Metabacillus arenae]MBD1382447.1 galactosyldiacylglycerol synthase [Metabacillus arenae]